MARVARVIVVVACAAVLAACSTPGSTPPASTGAEASGAASGADSAEVEPAGPDAGDEGAASEEVAVAQGSPVAVEASDVSVTKAISAAVGGKVSLRTADRERISLQIPPNALPVDSIITITQATANGMPAIVLEPAGLYLTRPARLTVPKSWASPRYTAFIRAGFTPEGELFVPAAEKDELVLISRLRPVVFTDGSIVEASVEEQDPVDVVAIAAEQDATAGASGASGSDEAADAASPADEETAAEETAAEETAAEETAAEEPAAEEPAPGDEPDGRAAEAAQVAVAAIPAMTERCREPGAGKQLLEARRTAGPAAPQDLPECITRAVHVFAHTDFVWRVEGRTFDIEEEVVGLGEVSNAAESSTFPLQGQLVGAAESASIFMTTVAYGLGTLMGLPVPPPSDDKCSVSRLENGIMTASLEDLDDERVRVTLQPAGTYYEVCGRLDANVEMMSFLILRMLNGVGETDPLMVTLPRKGSSSNVKSMLKIVEQQGLRRKPNGDVVIGDSGLTISVGMTVTIAERLKDLQPKDDETDIQP